MGVAGGGEAKGQFFFKVGDTPPQTPPGECSKTDIPGGCLRDFIKERAGLH